MHFDDDMNARFIEQAWGPHVIRGAEEIRDDGSTLYNFPEVEDYLPEKIAVYRKKHDSHSVSGNILMVSSKRRAAVVITDALPDYQDPTRRVDVDPIRHVFITFDPAYSSKRKKNGCLQAMLVLINTGCGNLYAVDGFLGRGLSPMQCLDRIAVFIQNYAAKELIIETNAMQGWIATSIYEQLVQRGVSNSLCLTSAFNSQDKIDSITAFLEPIIRRGKLYIAPTLPELVNEIYGKSKHLDGIDSLSFTRFSRWVDLSDPPPRSSFSEEELYSQEQELIEKTNREKTGMQGVCPWVD